MRGAEVGKRKSNMHVAFLIAITSLRFIHLHKVRAEIRSNPTLLYNSLPSDA